MTAWFAARWRQDPALAGLPGQAHQASSRQRKRCLAERERREQPVARSSVAAALVAAEQQLLGLSAQHERKTLDESLAVALVVDVIPTRALAADSHGLRLADRSVLLLRELRGRAVELRQHACPERRLVSPYQRIARDRDELEAFRRLNRPAAAHDSPLCRRVEAIARAPHRLHSRRPAPPAAADHE